MRLITYTFIFKIKANVLNGISYEDKRNFTIKYRKKTGRDQTYLLSINNLVAALNISKHSLHHFPFTW